MRKILFVSAFVLAAAGSLLASEKGNFGENGTWTFSDDGRLTIGGNEEIPGYPTPWDLLEGITDVFIGEGITGIGSHAFYHCGNSILTYDIPASVTNINENAFGGNNNVTTIMVHWRGSNIPIISRVHNTYGEDFIMGIFAYGSGRNFDDITLSVPYGTANIYKYQNGWKDFNVVERPYALFYTIENGTLTVTHNPLSGDGFIGSAGDPWDLRNDFSHVVIGYGITSIPYGTFYHCGEYIKTIDIPASVTSIDEGALTAGGHHYEKLTVHWTDDIPAITTAHIGIGGDVSNVELSVPKDAGGLYAALAGWQDFRIVERDEEELVNPNIPDGINDVSVTKTVAGYYTLTGKKLSSEPETGIYIIIYDDGTAKKAVR